MAFYFLYHLIFSKGKSEVTNLVLGLRKCKELFSLKVILLRGMGEGIVRKFGMGVFTLLYLKQITNKDLLYSTGNSAQCYVAAWMGGEFDGEWIHTHEWLSLLTVHLKLTLLIGYSPTQNKKF